MAFEEVQLNLLPFILVPLYVNIKILFRSTSAYHTAFMPV